MLGRMHWRLRRVGVLVHDDPSYALYQLLYQRLYPASRPAPPVRSRPRGRGRP
jgi:hypothetical protein